MAPKTVPLQKEELDVDTEALVKLSKQDLLNLRRKELKAMGMGAMGWYEFCVELDEVRKRTKATHKELAHDYDKSRPWVTQKFDALKYAKRIGMTQKDITPDQLQKFIDICNGNTSRRNGNGKKEKATWRDKLRRDVKTAVNDGASDEEIESVVSEAVADAKEA